MSNKLFLIVIISIMGFGLFAQIIPDDNFREEINEALGQPPEYEPTIADLNGLTGTLNASNANIISIEGAQYLTNLIWLDLHINQISDISVLSGLSNLTRLDLWSNQISEINALTGLINLTRLELLGNQISDLTALSELTNLTYLSLHNNQISDIISLSGLTYLTILSLYNNQISDISALSGLTNLTLFRLDNNQVIDISAISSMLSLNILHLESNQITDISAISNLTNLNNLHLEDNQITDIFPLVENTNLGLDDYLYIQYLGIFTNPISQEALEVHIPILESRGFCTLNYPFTANLNVACYPFPTRHAENVAYNSELSWQGAESGAMYELYLGISNDNLIYIGDGLYTSNNTFTFSPELLPDTEYWWRIKSTSENESLWSGMWHFTTGNYTALNNDFVETIDCTDLKSAYPNPFNPTTTISFSIPEESKVELSISNIKGQRIITLLNDQLSVGQHSVIWDGRDYNNKRVSSGVYLYTLITGKKSLHKKMLLLE
ncbi:MAG: leucine-rich repeat domain-containing protein [Candidatus Cloacimonetes bacterium]|nr:leucine-rich repeat domain-containing protein [Candidatus Cloacimonadota bacterium]